MLENAAPRIGRFSQLPEDFYVSFKLVNQTVKGSSRLLFHTLNVEERLEMAFLHKVLIGVTTLERIPSQTIVSGTDSNRLNGLSSFPLDSCSQVVEFLNVGKIGV